MKPKLHIPSPETPAIELDPESRAAYIRFSSGKVAKSVELGGGDEIVVADLDANGVVVGLELVGLEDFSIQQFASLIQKYTQNTIDLAPSPITVPVHV